MSQAQESTAAASAVAEETQTAAPEAAGLRGLQAILDSAEKAEETATDYSEAGVRDFLEEELQKLLNPETDEEAAEEPEISAESETATETEEPETDEETEEETEETESEEKNIFEEEENKPILSGEEIDEHFKRTPIAARNEMKRYADYARKYEDFVNQIGGQDMIPVAAKITESLAARDHNGVFTSLVTTLGLPSFAEILDSAVDLAFVQPVTQGAPQDDSSKWFLAKLTEITDKAFQSRYGEGLDSQVIDRLVRLQKVGAFDLESLEELYADELKPENSPVVARLQAELAREREEKAKLAKEQEAREAEVAEQRLTHFDNLAETSVQKAFEPLFEQSTLRAVKGDKPEETAIKEALREAVVLQASKNLRSSDAFRALRDRFQKGEAGTGVFTADLQAAVSAARTATRPFAAKFERLFRDVYLNKRNSQVVAPETKPNGQKPETPTQTKQFDPGKSTKDMTDEEWDAYVRAVVNAAQ